MTYQDVYEAVYDTYHPPSAWERAIHEGEPESFNLAEEALGRHGDSGDVGLRVRDFETRKTETHTFGELNAAANRAANFLTAHLDRDERFGLLLEPRLALYACLFGGIKSQRVFVPLDTKFGQDAVEYRLETADATTLVTTADRLDTLDTDDIDTLERVVVVDEDDDGTNRSEVGVERIPYDDVTAESDAYEAIRTHPTAVYGIGYSSGTTGQPSQQTSPHATCVGIDPYLRFVVDLQPSDVYFAAASPAWAYGLTVGTLCPGLRGTAIGAYRGRFDIERWVETLDEWDVTNAMVAPTALRQLRAGDVDVSQHDVDLRVLVTAGEALDAATAQWCRDNLGTAPLDAYGLSEGGMLVCNYPFPDWEIKPGSMGKPLPGYELALVDHERLDAFEPTPSGPQDEPLYAEIPRVTETGRTGEIAVYQTGGHGPLDGLLGEGWLLTGDLAERDEDGYWWYRGRADEVIISAGYRIGPEEVQATLLDHDAVEEAGVVGVPDELRGTVVKAYVTLAPGYDANDALRDELVAFAKRELSKHEYPRALTFVDELPKTASDKINRQALRDRHERDGGG